jgi:LmbE family N-acetylglucosaminyl deacetylase
LLTENAEKLYGIVRNGRASAKRFVDYNPVRAILLVFSEMSIEYPIWDWDEQQQGKIPNSTAMKAWRVDIQSVLPKKREAIAAYRSQISNLIDDDPTGFQLSSEMLDKFLKPWEVYLEEISG